MIRQGFFRPGLDFVAVKRIKLTSTEFIEPGTAIDKSKIRLFHLRSLFQRRMVGIKGSEWVKRSLEAYRAKSVVKPEIATKTVPEKKVAKKPVKRTVKNADESND